MNQRERQRGRKWAARQPQKDVVLKIPDREPGEADATHKQLDYIRRLGAIDEAEIRKLGKWQASSLIDQLKTERSIYTQEKVAEYNRKSGCLGVVVFLALCVAVAVVAAAVLR